MISRATGLASLALLAWALDWTLRLAGADWLFVKGDAASIRQAARMAPENAGYAGALARAEPGRAVEILRAAAARHPLDGGLRIELGKAQEQRGDFSAARQSLLDATRLDRGFAPRAALAEFYCHRRDAERFWPAMREALSVSYGDGWEQFRQCWSLTFDAKAILERAIPDRPHVLRFYLDFLLNEKRLDASTPVALRVLARADRDSALSLLNYCDRMLENGRGEQAQIVWDGLVDRNLVVESGRGFDWRISNIPGIRVQRSAGGWTVHFSGMQPETAEILARYVTLDPARRYILRCPVPERSGLACALTHGRLVLLYRRPPGASRLEGPVQVGEPGVTQ